jgi:hypothetical protein
MAENVKFQAINTMKYDTNYNELPDENITDPNLASKNFFETI